MVGRCMTESCVADGELYNTSESCVAESFITELYHSYVVTVLQLPYDSFITQNNNYVTVIWPKKTDLHAWLGVE